VNEKIELAIWSNVTANEAQQVEILAEKLGIATFDDIAVVYGAGNRLAVLALDIGMFQRIHLDREV
jgi:hypothetical protein